MNKKIALLIIILLELILGGILVFRYIQSKNSKKEISAIKKTQNDNQTNLEDMWTKMLPLASKKEYSQEVQDRIDAWTNDENSVIKSRIEELARLYKFLVNPKNSDEVYLSTMQRILGIEGCFIFSNNQKYEDMLSDRFIILENKNHFQMIQLRESMLQRRPKGLKLPLDSASHYRSYCQGYLKGETESPPLDEFTY